MVLLIIKQAEKQLFALTSTTPTLISEISTQITTIQNRRLALMRLVSACADLLNHGPAKNPKEHGLDEEQLGGEVIEAVERVVDGVERVVFPDPTGRRIGVAVSYDIQNMFKKELASAESIIMNTTIPIEILEIDEAFRLIGGAVTIAYPMGLPEYDAVREILEGNDEPEGADLKAVLGKDVCLWWANKMLAKDKKLADYVGRNEKTKIIVKVQASGTSGAPVKEAPLDEKGQKEMMAYYHKKQEENKRLMEDAGDEYMNSPWADSKSLKSAFQGIGGGGISFGGGRV